MSDIDFMHQAIAQARAGIPLGQSPFGAVVVRAGQVVCGSHNRVRLDTDPTAHAEIVAIRQAARALGTIHLDGCTMYTTCEPCPMCLAAIHWARIDRVVYGADIADAEAAGFRELHLPAGALAIQGGSPLIVQGGVCRQECADLFCQWREAGLAAPY